MNRKHQENVLKQIINVCYRSLTIAHSFLSSAFVEKGKFYMSNVNVPDSETWVYEIDNLIVGFLNKLGNEIGGLFVLPMNQTNGYGKTLINFTKENYSHLEVDVFDKNLNGKGFNKKYGFKQRQKFKHKERGNDVLRLKFICKKKGV